MAKIGNLEVDTLNIAEAAINGFVLVTANANMNVPNAELRPIMLFARCIATYNGSSAGATGSAELKIQRTTAPASVIHTETINFAGNGSIVNTLEFAALDPPGAASSVSYACSAVGFADNIIATVTISQREFAAQYTKR